MIIVSDTSPLTSLAAIGQLELLRKVYGAILIPPAVARELRKGEELGDHAPFLRSTPWITIAPTPPVSLVDELLLEEVNLGEAEAIALAIQSRADLLLIDEAAGRKAAEARGLDMVGLLGTLLTAKAQGWLAAVKPVMDDLIQNAGFWVSSALYEHILIEAGEQ